MLTSFCIAILVCAFYCKNRNRCCTKMVLLMYNYSINTKAFHAWHYCNTVVIVGGFFFVIRSGPFEVYIFDSNISIIIHNEY